MVSVSIKMVGMAQALKAVQVIGAGGEAASGPIASWTSPLRYAGPVEYVWRKGSGGAHMFQKGIAETAQTVPGIMGPAIIKGPAAVGGARRQIQNLGAENIRKYTPVRTGRLRASVTAVSRPRTA
jgi:hypothetical protein